MSHACKSCLSCPCGPECKECVACLKCQKYKRAGMSNATNHDNGRITIDGHETCRSEMDELRRIIKETRAALKDVGQLAYAASLSATQAMWVSEECKSVGVDLEDSE